MKLKVTVQGVAYEVEVEVLDAGDGFLPPPSALPSVQLPSRSASAGAPAALPPPPAPAGPAPTAAGPGGAVQSPIAGTVVEVKCKAGDKVDEGQVLIVLEAMKMNTSIAAPAAGTVKKVPVAVGDAITEQQILVEME